MFGLSLHLSSQAKNDNNVELSESNEQRVLLCFFFPSVGCLLLFHQVWK